MPLQQILPTWLALNGCNDTSASGFQDLRTLQPVNAGGLNLGDYFDVTNAEAKSLQYSTNGVLFAGRYRRVQVDSGATAANVKTGTIGLMPSLAAIAIDGYPANTPSANVVTSYDQSLALTSQVRPVIFLNTVTPGNFCFVQELGVATVGFSGRDGGRMKDVCDHLFVAPSFSIHRIQETHVTLLHILWDLVHVLRGEEDVL